MRGDQRGAENTFEAEASSLMRYLGFEICPDYRYCL